jgi:hypothetical protein
MNLAKVKDAAETLALESVEYADVTKVIWFPHESQVRLVEVDPTVRVSPDYRVCPFYVMDEGVEAGIALIHPDEERKLVLPDGWGTWDDGVYLYGEP